MSEKMDFSLSVMLLFGVMCSVEHDFCDLEFAFYSARWESCLLPGNNGGQWSET